MPSLRYTPPVMWPRWQQLRQDLARSAPKFFLGLIILGALYQALCHTEAFADDAAITFSYSRQLAENGELIHTASSERVEGFSNPTWTLLCTLPFLLHMDPYIYARTLGVFLLVVMILLVDKTAQRLCPRSQAARFAAPLLAGMSPIACFWTMAGLENPLIAFLLAALIYQAIIEEQDTQPRQLSGGIAALLALSRPEGIVYVGPLFFYKLLKHLQSKGPRKNSSSTEGVTVPLQARSEEGARPSQDPELRRHLANLLGFAVPLLAFVLWRRLYFSAWLPNTYYAKVTSMSLLPSDHTPEGRGLRYIRAFFQQNELWSLVYASPLAFFARKGWAEAAFIVALGVAHIAFVYIVDGDWMGDFRFFAFAMPIYALLLALTIQGAGDLFQRLGEWLRRARAGALLGRLVAAALLLTFLATSLLPTLTGYSRMGWVSMELVRQQAFGLEKIARRSGLLQASIAVPDVGGSALYSNVKVIDTVGLTDAVIARSKNRPARLRQYFFEEAQPDFYQAHSHWTRYYNLSRHFEFQQDYVTFPEKVTKRMVLLGENSVRREHLTGFPGEAEQELEIDLGHGLTLRGYDTPVIVHDQLVFQLYVEVAGFQRPASASLPLTIELRPAPEGDQPSLSADLATLPESLFQDGTTLRLRFSARTEDVEAFAVHLGRQSEALDWIATRPVHAGRRRGSAIEGFLLNPRTHFACALPLPRKQGFPRALGRIQRFESCTPQHRANEVRQLVTTLERRARRALDVEMELTAIFLLGRAELLRPTSSSLRRLSRHSARVAERRARRLAATEKLRAAQTLAHSALKADPLLSRARALDLTLVERGLQYYPDQRERHETARRRLRQHPDSTGALREMLVAAADAHRPLDAARLLVELDLDAALPEELRADVAAAYLAVGLCSRALRVLENTENSSSCDDQWIRYRAQRICSNEDGPRPSCEAPNNNRQSFRALFEFEGSSIQDWELSGPLHEPEERPWFYTSGYSGLGALRTAWAVGGARAHFTATSPVFTIDDDALSLQVAGGRSSDGVEIQLLIGDRVVRRAAGQRDHHLRRVTWDLRDLARQEARIRVQDRGRGRWGHLIVDHVRLHPRHLFDANVEPTP